MKRRSYLRNTVPGVDIVGPYVAEVVFASSH